MGVQRVPSVGCPPSVDSGIQLLPFRGLCCPRAYLEVLYWDKQRERIDWSVLEPGLRVAVFASVIFCCLELSHVGSCLPSCFPWRRRHCVWTWSHRDTRHFDHLSGGGRVVPTSSSRLASHSPSLSFPLFPLIFFLALMLIVTGQPENQ